MDKNQVTGLILMSVLMLVWFYFFQPKPTEQVEPQEPVIEAPTVEPTSPIEDIVEEQDNFDTTAISELGPFSVIMKGTAENIEIENDQVKYTFSTRGGIIRKAILKDFLTADQQELVILDEKSSKIKEVIDTRYGKIDLNEAIFKPNYSSQKVQGSDSLQISFTAKLSNGKSIVKKYKIPGTGYRVFQDIDVSGLNEELISQNVAMTWTNNLKKFEKDLKTSQVKATINYYTSLGDFDNLSESSSDFEEESISEMVKWVSFKQKFFSTGIVANGVFSGAYIATDPNSNDAEIVKSCLFKTNISLENYGSGFHYYYGPNNYQILKKVTDGFNKNIYLGWTPVNMVNKFLIIPTFNFLERYMSNYGIIIILLVLFIKLLLSPLTYKSYISMAKTKVLKPELDAIKEQYGDDMQKVQSEQMTLYRQVGVNPISGCIPLLLQMPILFSMFYFFPNSIELRQEAFLWADDLSTFDSVLSLPFSIPAYGDHVSLFTILMTASTILYTWSNNQVTTVQGPMKSMQYLMPVVFMFVLNSFPAALSFYYFVSNLVTFGQQALIRKFVDEEKIKRILDENRKKSGTKKKSKFQMRLEEAMKSAEETKKKSKK